MTLCLCVLLLLGMLPACGNAQDSEETTTEAPAPTESPEEEEVLKIMILGSPRYLRKTKNLPVFTGRFLIISHLFPKVGYFNGILIISPLFS